MKKTASSARRFRVVSLIFSGLLFYGILIGSSVAGSSCDSGSGCTPVSTSGDSIPLAPEQQQICSGTPIPPGWIRAYTQTNLTSCGSYNCDVTVIYRYDILPVGYQINVDLQAVPAGWVQIAQSRDITRCGYYSGGGNNVMTIKKIN